MQYLGQRVRSKAKIASKLGVVIILQEVPLHLLTDNVSIAAYNLPYTELFFPFFSQESVDHAERFCDPPPNVTTVVHVGQIDYGFEPFENRFPDPSP